MLTRPLECNGCPLNSISSGFSQPEGKGSLGVMIVGEALGEQEATSGLPFRPWAAAGSLLERAIRRCGYSREQFVLWNIVACRPPNNVLEGAPYYRGAVEHCKTHFQHVLDEFRPKVILALGGVALETLTGMSGTKRTISYLRGYVLGSHYNILVVPSFHPAFIRRGQSHLQSVLMHDMKLAVGVAQKTLRMEADYGFDIDAWLRENPGYIPHPSLEQAVAFLQKVRRDPTLLVAYDIETPYSAGVDEPDQLDEDLGDGITQIQFSLSPGSGICFPWEGDYIQVAKAILASPNPKVGQNVYKFDNPRLRRVGCTINGRIDDTLWMWHHLQPDLPAHLQFIASFYGMPWPWKHLAGVDDAIYGIADVDSVQRIMTRLPDQLRSRKIWTGYERHVRQLYPVLEDMSRRGMPVDRELRASFESEMEIAQREVSGSLQGLYPRELLKVHPKEGYKKAPKNPDGLELRQFQDENGGLVERWCRVEPFLPGSPQQVLAYVSYHNHPKPIDSKTRKLTTADKQLARLAIKTRDPFYEGIQEWREISKLTSTFLPGWEPDEQGRVHSEFYFAPATGQLSSRSPNIQNSPKHGKLAERFRGLVAARPGYKLVECDYKSFHALTLGWCAKDPDYMRLARLDIHSYLTAWLIKATDRYDMLGWPDDVLEARLMEIKKEYKEIRDQKAKPTVLGYGFGLGANRLWQENEGSIKSRAEAQALIDTLNEAFPRTAHFRDAIRHQAHRDTFLLSPHGYVRWFFSVFIPGQGARLCGYCNRQHAQGEEADKAIAFLPANIAFGIIKNAMLRLRERGLDEKYGLINQIHDSLLFECREEWVDECVREVKQEMEKPEELLDDPVVSPGGLWCGVEAKVGLDWSKMETIE